MRDNLDNFVLFDSRRCDNLQPWWDSISLHVYLMRRNWKSYDLFSLMLCIHSIASKHGHGPDDPRYRVVLFAFVL